MCIYFLCYFKETQKIKFLFLLKISSIFLHCCIVHPAHITKMVGYTWWEGSTAECNCWLLRTYWDCISACCSWLGREEQWLQNAVTINHPVRPVWYGYSQQEYRGEGGLMSAQHGWSYQQIPPQQGDERLYWQHQQRSLFLYRFPKQMIYEWNQDSIHNTTCSVYSSTTQHVPTTHRWGLAYLCTCMHLLNVPTTDHYIHVCCNHSNRGLNIININPLPPGHG